MNTARAAARRPGAFLALWNSISQAELQPEYETWHTFEHVPERVGLPGFIEARRYRSVNPNPGFTSAGEVPHYFTCYWLDDLQALDSERYREVFSNPTPWSARMRTELREFFRLPCALRGCYGPSTARYVATLHLRGATEALKVNKAPSGLVPSLPRALDTALGALQARAGVVSAQWGAVQAPGDFQIPIQQDAAQDTVTQLGSDVVLMLHALELPTLVAACQWLQQTLQPVATPVTPPAFYVLLSQVRQADLAHPLEQRQPALLSLQATFS